MTRQWLERSASRRTSTSGVDAVHVPVLVHELVQARHHVDLAVEGVAVAQRLDQGRVAVAGEGDDHGVDGALADQAGEVVAPGDHLDREEGGIERVVVHHQDGPQSVLREDEHGVDQFARDLTAADHQGPAAALGVSGTVPPHRTVIRHAQNEEQDPAQRGPDQLGVIVGPDRDDAERGEHPPRDRELRCRIERAEGDARAVQPEQVEDAHGERGPDEALDRVRRVRGRRRVRRRQEEVHDEEVEERQRPRVAAHAAAAAGRGTVRTHALLGTFRCCSVARI
nr:hypothetical protein [Tsukamurella conjunctivitidis]